VINFYKGLRGFAKESTVYERILPRISSRVSSPRLPRCFLTRGGQGDPRRELLVLEDLREYGFRNAEDFGEEHFLAALRALASFHAASMLAQRDGTLDLKVNLNFFRNPLEEFNQIYKTIRLNTKGI
jgi:hypothetical protein